ncbi:uncharacterized protein KY384_000342 [Bacidia gigantensis]|uniref:uncharacterized protein n=1 Tax=Bacidia gigantensis TaxID=2732470 RepID=UPI001D036918|nr:uncharacterized protein KY384_000342 [Bacidia gigantensis]KAG8526349.1 hypothetical protein KY384_000342 [Bacidia gigantensis]
MSLPSNLESPEALAITPPVSQFDMPAKISYGPDDFDHQRLHVSWPEPSQPPAPAYSEHGFAIDAIDGRRTAEPDGKPGYQLDD